MSGFTIKNLFDIEDAWGGQTGGGVEGRFARSHIDSEHIGVSYIRYQPGVRSPMAHSHREQEEVFVVISGSGRALLDDAPQPLKQWDVVRIAPPTVRAFEAGADGLVMIAIGSDRPKEADGVRADANWPE